MNRISRSLPLYLLAAMLSIACGIELAGFDRLLWTPKLPVALLLAAALVREHRRGRGAAP